MAFIITYDIFCDNCAIWIGNGYQSKSEVITLAKKKGWKITARSHKCPACAKIICEK